MQNYLLIGLLIVYIVFTLLFAIKFHKADIYFNRRQKLIHSILIWLVPFIWILLIRAITKPAKGKERTIKGNFYESGIGMWNDGQSE